ncbi:MAG: hypothetical protein KatS3mg068_1391 [Candidatus Sericytochromatia bacterium]|nr:MAG: hypothetical protein KatS3mg068_1391 [Candidatus Sericytochromatia bacterium]
MENDKIDKNNILKLNIPQEFNLKDIKNKKLQKIHDQAIQKYLKAKDIKELDDVILMLNRRCYIRQR